MQGGGLGPRSPGPPSFSSQGFGHWPLKKGMRDSEWEVVALSYDFAIPWVSGPTWKRSSVRAVAPGGSGCRAPPLRQREQQGLCLGRFSAEGAAALWPREKHFFFQESSPNCSQAVNGNQLSYLIASTKTEDASSSSDSIHLRASTNPTASRGTRRRARGRGRPTRGGTAGPGQRGQRASVSWFCFLPLRPRPPEI